MSTFDIIKEFFAYKKNINGFIFIKNDIDIDNVLSQV